MVQSIIAYIDFLEQTYDLQISLHGKGLAAYLDSFAPYNAHSCGYCMYVKGSEECWKRCRESQRRAEEKAENGMFFGSCYAGVGEFVFPICAHGQIVGIISIGGYWGSTEKRTQFAKRYGFYEEKLEQLAAGELKKEIPSMAFIKTLIAPLGAMLTLLIEHSEAVADEPKEVYGKVLSIIHTEYTKRLTVEDIAKKCHYSKSFISRRFRERSGMTVNAYLNSLRMEKAKKLLLESEMRIEDIAVSVGFSDTNYFIAFFSRFYGLPPGQYRKAYASQRKQKQILT